MKSQTTAITTEIATHLAVKAKKTGTDSISAMLTMALLVCTLLIGWYFSRTEFISPEAGLGYALGIAGSSMMAVMLIYPLRKRMRSLRFLGSLKHWFRAHMMFGVIGPTLVVLHTNYRLGSTNSRVALFCMIIVALSGFIGRYLYRQIHHGLYGQRASLRDLQSQSLALREGAELSKVSFLDFNSRLQDLELALEKPDASFLASLVQPFVVNVKTHLLKRSIMREVRAAIATQARESKAIASQSKRLLKTTERYLSNRLGMSRRIAMFRVYEKLFSLWHILHIPLFVLLVLAVIVHIYAVHAY